MTELVREVNIKTHQIYGLNLQLEQVTYGHDIELAEFHNQMHSEPSQHDKGYKSQPRRMAGRRNESIPTNPGTRGLKTEVHVDGTKVMKNLRLQGEEHCKRARLLPAIKEEV